VQKQLLLNIDGEAGTGKSFLTMNTCAKLESMMEEAPDPGDNPVKRLAPTGVAAFNIMGKTLYAAFRLLKIMVGEYVPLRGAALKTMQQEFKHVSYVIIDKKSMIGLTQFTWVEKRCRQIRPSIHEPFGSINIIIFGDFWQLPPVSAKALFASDPKTPEESLGQLLWRSFDKTIQFLTIKRQQGADPAFIAALSGLRNNNVTVEHWRTLCARTKNIIGRSAANRFDNDIRLFGHRESVNEYNSIAIAELDSPVKILKAQHNRSEAQKSDFDTGGNLHAAMPLCQGCRVMITRNLWTEKGVVNGSAGLLRDIVWLPGADTNRDLPFCIFVELDKYTGPTFDRFTSYDPEFKVVPIFAAESVFLMGSVECSRKQFLLAVASAITIHKS
jgi:ATP-dependent DNA helicase PIF1